MQKRDHTDQIQAEAAWERTRSIDTHHQISIDKRPQQSIDFNNTTSIDNHPIPKTTVSEKVKLDNQYLTPDEFGIFRDPNGFAKATDGRTLHVSREYIADILQTANGADNLFMHQRRKQKTTKEFYDTAGGIENSFNQRSHHTTHPLIYHGLDPFLPMELKRDFIRADRGRYEDETIDRCTSSDVDRCTSSDVDRYRREASTIEDYDRSMYILYHRSMSRRGSATWFQPTLNPRLHQITRLPLFVRQQVNAVDLGNDLGYIVACHCGAEYETEYSESIDTHTVTSIDSNESPTTDERYPTSLDRKQLVDHSTLPNQYFPDFAFQQRNNRGRDDYSIGSWADSGFHESFAVETVILSSNEDPTEEYDEDYWKKRATEIAMQDERYSTHSFINTPPPTIDSVYSALVDTHPHPAKRSSASIDTTPGTSIDIKAAALEKEIGNIPIPSRDSDGHARAMDGRILQVSREDITNILQLANGEDKLFMQQRSIPHINPAVPEEYPRATTTGIGSHQSCTPVGQASIDKVASTSFDRVTPTSIDKAPSPSINRRYECGRRAYDSYGARKFKWE
ncbi:hypothetical protein F2Q69_00047311 [Brassica cretica]|uniref:Uncharacterized protein n=1 Tax=Brassica cretica TaxID=69181 RepID=A0A8S9PVE9_BRACR|nr:hypothetical protein F2Q69_00047311 [Brassica cretica]